MAVLLTVMGHVMQSMTIAFGTFSSSLDPERISGCPLAISYSAQLVRTMSRRESVCVRVGFEEGLKEQVPITRAELQLFKKMFGYEIGEDGKAILLPNDEFEKITLWNLRGQRGIARCTNHVERPSDAPQWASHTHATNYL
jgi:hypothetical protein